MSSVAILDFAEPLPAVTLHNLVEVARQLGRSGALLAVRCDETSGRLTFLRLPERIPAAPAAVPPEPSYLPRRAAPRYEEEGGERSSRWSVRVAEGARWSGSLEVPPRAPRAALLTIERLGGIAMLEPSQAVIVIPVTEAAAVLDLLEGLFAQARRDGVLPHAAEP